MPSQAHAVVNSLNTMSRVAYDDLLDSCRRSGTLIYTVRVKSGAGLDPRSKLKPSFVMDSLARETGARAFLMGHPADLPRLFAHIGAELRNQYLLGYASNNPIRDDAWRRIRVEVDGHGEVRARQGYRLATR